MAFGANVSNENSIKLDTTAASKSPLHASPFTVPESCLLDSLDINCTVQKTTVCMQFREPGNLSFHLSSSASVKVFRATRPPSVEYTVREVGEPQSLEYRVYFYDKDDNIISPWHNIPLQPSKREFNFIVEIPKETSDKMEVATKEENNPIKQDTVKGRLRKYPYNIKWNYGLLPQTWENPSHCNPDVENAYGDNDPLDVVEIGERKPKVGEVLKVKPLAVLAMIDEGELDWKVIAISLDDPKAHLVNDMGDMDEHFPGTLTEIREWFRDYRIPDGKPPNKFGLGNKPANKAYTLKVIAKTHDAWKKLINKSLPANDLSLV